MTLELLQAQAQNCTACRLAEGRTRVVFGEGNPDAKLMIVGEGPGEEEDKTGRPFVGKAGQLLNRAPLPDEAKICTDKWLLKQIELIAPQIIVPLGAVAAEFFLGEKVSITKVRGKWYEWHGIKVFPMFHPAYLLRNPSRAPGSPKHLTWLDIQEVKRALDALPPKERGPAKAVSQEPLF